MERDYREVDRFEVETDDGEIFMVVKSIPITKTRHLGGTSIAKGKPIPLLRLTDGRLVSPTDDPDEFKIFDTDEVIRKI
ncbi:MAG: hypothetical protein O7I42_10395 [Alphaproteobacteria bacterium]|nr:hypothetical protein [Alphaproteobacteria bacterium]